METVAVSPRAAGRFTAYYLASSPCPSVHVVFAQLAIAPLPTASICNRTDEAGRMKKSSCAVCCVTLHLAIEPQPVTLDAAGAGPFLSGAVSSLHCICNSACGGVRRPGPAALLALNTTSTRLVTEEVVVAVVCRIFF